MNRNLLLPLALLARARRSCSLGTAVAISLSLVLLTLALLAALDLFFPFPRGVRITLLIAGALALPGGIFGRWMAARRRHTHSTAAQDMETAHPELGQQLRTALEVVQRGVPNDAGPEANFFAARLIAEAEESVARHSWKLLVPRRRLMQWTAAVLAIALALGIAAWRLPDFGFALSRFVAPATASTYTRLTWVVAPRVFDDRHPPRFELRIDRRLAEPTLYVRERGGEWVKTGLTALPDGRSWDVVLTGRTNDLELYATAGDGRTVTHAASFEPIPKLIATSVQLTFPEYTGLKTETRKQGDVSVVEDTHARWNFTFNVPPKTIEWRIGTETPQRLTVDRAAKAAATEWTAGNGRLNAVLSVLDDAGEVLDSWRYVAEGFADALPTVELLEPVKDQEATSVTELPARIRAKDDFGVSEVGLVLEVAGQREWVLEKVIPERDQKNVSEIASAMLEKVPLTLRDNVRLYAYALDHKPRGGPRAVSPLRSIDIREFKKRWRFLDGDGGAGGLSPAEREKISEGVMQLGQLITKQRTVVSDTFLLRESTRSAGTAVTAAAQPIGKREQELSVKAGELLEQWLDGGAIPQDDVALLGTARIQMDEASTSLGLKGPANLDKGFATTDRALTTLLQLRKSLLTILMKGSPGQGEPAKPEDQMRSLADLAREAERLAREERDVHGQLAPEAAAGTNLEATRRQHEVVVNDGGELYATLVDHPQINEAAVRLMDAAEKALRQADEALHGEQPREKAPPLHALTERRLLETAEFLRAMELNQAAETLNKLASKAEQNAQAMQKGKAAGGEGGKGETGKPAEKEDAKGDDPGESARQAARETAMADDILAALTEKAGGAGKVADNEAANAPDTPKAQPGLGAELAELRAQTAPGKLAGELGKLAEQQGQKEGGGAEGQKQAAKASDDLKKMAREFRGAAQRLEASRAARLAAAQAQARELEKQLAAAGEKGDGKNGEEPGGQDGGKGKGAGQKPGQSGALAKAEQPGANGAGKQPGEKGAGQGKGGKEGAGAGGDQPGEKPGGQGLAKGDQPGQSGSSDKPQDGKANGRGGIAGDLEKVENGGGGQAMGRFGQALRGLGDDKLNNLSIKLFNAPFSRDSLPLVEAAAQRIDELVADLPAIAPPLASARRVPEARRREVEDYFRDLSDDFAGEQWEAPPAPELKKK